MKDITNVGFSVHKCVMETWHAQCSKDSKQPMWQQEHFNHYNVHTVSEQTKHTGFSCDEEMLIWAALICPPKRTDIWAKNIFIGLI